MADVTAPRAHSFLAAGTRFAPCPRHRDLAGQCGLDRSAARFGCAWMRLEPAPENRDSLRKWELGR
eukprot:5301655-Pyramimonas_sp.AAC.1